MMKRAALAFAVLLCSVTAFASDPPKRPRIFGIAGVQVFTTDPRQSREFYSKVIDAMQPSDCDWCARVPGRFFSVNGVQVIALSPSPSPIPHNFIGEITFATEDIRAMRRYLEFHKIAVKQSGATNTGMVPLTMMDPEGHRISFVQWIKAPWEVVSIYSPRLQIIHTGFVVKDRAAEDRFYRDILGFHVYWHGGMTDDGVDEWVDMQVPDGTDWLEYMLNVSPNADKRELGVMDHVAIGVKDIRATYDELVARGVKLPEKPQIGRDGKWQLNLYDPDDTRVEFMERTPTNEPCCSAYQGPHPGELAKPQVPSPQ